MDTHDIDILERKTLFQGYFRVDRYRLKHRLFQGGWSGEVIREVFERGHAVGVLPYDPVHDRLVLIEQFRVGALAGSRPPWMMECVAGIIGEGEEIEAVAHRETEEEIGCTLTRLEPIGIFVNSPGACSETCRLFMGEVDSTAAGGIHGLESEAEDIKTHVVPAETAIAWADEGRIENSVLLIGLLWFARHREALRARWLANRTGAAE